MDMRPMPMDYVVDALANALASNMTLEDVFEAAVYADDVEAFNDAVNIMGLATAE
jgi:hypothetical protein